MEFLTPRKACPSNSNQRGFHISPFVFAILLLVGGLFFPIIAAHGQRQLKARPPGGPSAAASDTSSPQQQPDPRNFGDHEGWLSLFDGKTLNGWDGRNDLWKVQDGAITAESTAENPSGTAYLIWQGDKPGDFELRLEIKGEGARINSGVQYRSVVQAPAPSRPGGPQQNPENAKFNLAGPQFDFDGINVGTGQLYEGLLGRGVIAGRSWVVQANPGKWPIVIGSLGDYDELGGYVKINDWNEYDLIARGHIYIHIINGHVVAIVDDEDPVKFRTNGLIGLQIEGIGRISFRNIWLKKLN